ncbi:MAG: lipoprotein [Alphaproteobacteria bacterium]|nr:lipoprotein [Alphaproteobacteria bacterium]
MKRILGLFILGLTLFLSACNEKTYTNRIYVFSQPGCGHCTNAHHYMARYYKDYDIKELNIREGSNMGYMLRYAKKFKVPEQTLGTPFIVMGDNYVMGWGSEQIKEFNKYAKSFKPKSSK